MNRELVWLMLPVVGFLSQIGGTYNKLFRRLGVPLIITMSSFLLFGFSWWLPALFLTIFGVACLPFTLIGDSLQASWVNWVWIWVSGYLLGLPSLFLSDSGWLYAFVPCVVQGICGTLSNIQATAKYFQWKFCEFIIWASMAYCYALALSLR